MSSQRALTSGGDEDRLESGRALAICGQVAAALDAAHRRGLVHRDVKPSNVLLDENEHVYLADFGLSRRLGDRGGVGEGQFSVGTPAYVSPEQIEGREADGRADVYSLGCLVYECLTGHVPFSRASELAMLWAHLQEPPPRASEHNADLPIELDAVFDTALAKDPEQRYATCSALFHAVREALGAVQTAPRIRRQTIAVAAAAVLSTVVAVAAGLVLAFGGTSPQAKPSLVVRDNTLVRIDPTRQLRLADSPVSIALGEGSIWVTTIGTVRGGALLRIDPRTETITGRLDIADLDATPNSIAVGEGAVWLTDSGVTRSRLLRVDPKTMRVTGTHPFDCSSGFCWTANGSGSVWIATNPTAGRARLLRIDPRTLRVTGVILAKPAAADFGPGPDFTIDGSTIWWGGDPVVRVDTQASRIVGTIRLTGHSGLFTGPGAIVTGGGGVWTTYSAVR